MTEARVKEVKALLESESWTPPLRDVRAPRWRYLYERVEPWLRDQDERQIVQCVCEAYFQWV